MQVRWKQLIIQFSVWLMAEVVFTSIGIDDLADYSEYQLASKTVAIAPIVFII
ncbi:MAG: hypothetical protein VKJ64_01125 [Leptolyngbyaceae bacterium]|nr:hypothetical protein [Leptolyngbyaceae bacterium]